MPRVRLVPAAQRDMRAIGRYIADRNHPAALKFYDGLRHTFRMLSRQPLLGEVVPEFGTRLRCFPVGNYVVYYEPIPGGVRIIRVIHGARDQDRAFDQSE
jgi:toxin ParE1/3/4